MSDDIILGLEDNNAFLSTIEDGVIIQEESKDKKVKKLPANERRKVALKELALAIENKDVEEVERIFEENPKLSLPNMTYNYSELSLKHFHPQIMHKMLDQGLSIDIYDLEGESLDVIKFFTGYYKRTYQTSNNDVSKNNNKIDDEYESKWRYLYRSFIKKLPDKKTIKIISHLEKEFDGIENKIDHYAVMMILKRAPLKDNEWYKNKLKKIPENIWVDVFSETFTVTSIFKGNGFTIENMKFFTDLLKEDKNIKRVWNEVQEKHKSNYLKRQAWHDKYLPYIISLKDEIDNFEYKPLNDLKHFMGFYIGKKNIEIKNGLVSSIYAYSDEKNKTYLSLKDYIMVNLDHIIAGIDFSSHKDSNGNTLFTSNPLKFTPPSFSHHIVLSGSDLLLSLTKTNEGKDLFLNSLKDPYILMSFIKNVSTKTFISLTKQVSKLKDFKDKHGNNLGHIFIDLTSEKNKTNLLAMAKVAPNWFEDKNYEGKTIIDILKDDDVASSTIAQIEKQLLLSSLKGEDVSGAKLRSRVKHVNKKKKM